MQNGIWKSLLIGQIKTLQVTGSELGVSFWRNALDVPLLIMMCVYSYATTIAWMWTDIPLVLWCIDLEQDSGRCYPMSPTLVWTSPPVESLHQASPVRTALWSAIKQVHHLHQPKEHYDVVHFLHEGYDWYCYVANGTPEYLYVKKVAHSAKHTELSTDLAVPLSFLGSFSSMCLFWFTSISFAFWLQMSSVEKLLKPYCDNVSN